MNGQSSLHASKNTSRPNPEKIALRRKVKLLLAATAFVAKASASSTTTAPAAAMPTVTFLLSYNDDGQGHDTSGQYAIYAIDSTADGNHGLSDFSVSMNSFDSATNFAPKGIYDNGTGNGKTVAEGFTIQRSGNGAYGPSTNPITGSQDLTGDPSSVKLIYGMGQVAGNLNASAPAGSTGNTDRVRPVYGAPLLIETGNFTDAFNGFQLLTTTYFNGDQSLDKADVFPTGSTADITAASIAFATQNLEPLGPPIVPFPEPTSLGVVALATGGVGGRTRRRRRAHR